MPNSTCRDGQLCYLFQRWLGAFVVDDAHAEAIRKLGTIISLEISVKASRNLDATTTQRRRGVPGQPFLFRNPKRQQFPVT